MDLKLHNVNKTYSGKDILIDINLDVKNESGIAIIGPSGAGKSTLLRLLSLIEKPDSGEICVNDYDLNTCITEDYYKNIGFVFQSHNLFPHLTVLRNITLLLEQVHHKSKEESNQIALELLDRFDLGEHIHKRASQLSGGQSQRVSIVRGIAISPEVLFFDEPTSSLDPALTQEVLKTILRLREEKMNFVIVTHEILFAKKAADFIIFMDQGKIVEMGHVDILDNPETDELKSFLSNVFLW